MAVSSQEPLSERQTHQLLNVSVAFCKTPAPGVVTQHSGGPTRGLFLFFFFFFIMRCYSDRKPEVVWQKHRRRRFFLPLGGKTSLASISLSLLEGRKGHQHRGIAVESVAAKNQTAAGFSLGLESQRLHTAHHAGFYWPFSITPVTQDWVCRSVSFSWKGQSRLFRAGEVEME